MRLEDALLIVKRCIIQTTSFRDPRPKSPHKELRAQDTLEYAGITDASRLDTLQRYLVRNTDLGVQSIWGVRLGETSARPYLIPNEGLSKLDKTWSLERLARELIKNAGLPYVTYERAAKVAADCRYKAFDGKPVPKTRAVDSTITSDLGARTEAFRTCVFTDPERGLPAVGITDGEGDFYPYVVTDDLRLRVSGAIDVGKYEDLVTIMRDRLYVDLSKRLTAQIIVGNWFIRRTTPDCRAVSFPLFGLCVRGAAPPEKRQTFETTPTSLMINPATEPQDILTSFRKDQNTCSARIPPLDAISSKSAATARKAMDAVETVLEGVNKCL
jgi:hypothetical protein